MSSGPSWPPWLAHGHPVNRALGGHGGQDWPVTQEEAEGWHLTQPSAAQPKEGLIISQVLNRPAPSLGCDVSPDTRPNN